MKDIIDKSVHELHTEFGRINCRGSSTNNMLIQIHLKSIQVFLENKRSAKNEYVWVRHEKCNYIIKWIHPLFCHEILTRKYDIPSSFQDLLIKKKKAPIFVRVILWLIAPVPVIFTDFNSDWETWRFFYDDVKLRIIIIPDSVFKKPPVLSIELQPALSQFFKYPFSKFFSRKYICSVGTGFIICLIIYYNFKSLFLHVDINEFMFWLLHWTVVLSVPFWGQRIASTWAGPIIHKMFLDC